jgi:hypothetical protein
MRDKRVRLTVEFRISFREITPETVLRMNPSRDLRDVLRSFVTLKDVARQGRLLRALLDDEEALRGFLACAVIDEVAAGGGELLRKALRAESNKEVLRPVTDRLGGEDAEFYEGAREEGVFDEQIDMVLYSTPVECLGVRVEEVSEGDGESGESDNLR